MRTLTLLLPAQSLLSCAVFADIELLLFAVLPDAYRRLSIVVVADFTFHLIKPHLATPHREAARMT
jgi:hypothetical protein